MATDTQQSVDALLADLTATVEGEAEPPEPEALTELADRADELLSTTELSALLDAAGLGTDDQPMSIPAAVASGDPENVARLRSVLTLSKLSTADGERASELAAELGSLAETAHGDGSTDETTAGDTGPGNGAEADTATDTETAADTDGTETTEATATTETGADTGTDERAEQPADAETADDEQASPLRAKLESQFSELQELLGQESDRRDAGLGERLDDLGETLDDPGEPTDDSEVDTDDSDAEPEHETKSSRSRDGTRFRPTGSTRATTHSTVPPTRRDIGRSGRFSTVRGSTISKR